MAESVEEAMRCPTQRWERGEVIGSLIPGFLERGERRQDDSEDSLTGTGRYRSPELGGGPYPYSWQQAQTRRFTVAVTGKGAEGWTEEEIHALTVRAQAAMLVRIGSALRAAP